MNLRLLLPPPLVLVLACAVGFEMLGHEQPTTNVDLHTTWDADIEQNPPPAFTLMIPDDHGERLSALSARPLFSETRRPPEPAPLLEPTEPLSVPEEGPEPDYFEDPPFIEPPSVSYRGFMRIGDHATALVMDQNTGEERWMLQEDDLDGWILHSVTSDSLIFQRGDIVHVVEVNQ